MAGGHRPISSTCGEQRGIRPLALWASNNPVELHGDVKGGGFDLEHPDGLQVGRMF